MSKEEFRSTLIMRAIRIAPLGLGVQSLGRPSRITRLIKITPINTDGAEGFKSLMATRRPFSVKKINRANSTSLSALSQMTRDRTGRPAKTFLMISSPNLLRSLGQWALAATTASKQFVRMVLPSPSLATRWMKAPMLAPSPSPLLV